MNTIREYSRHLAGLLAVSLSVSGCGGSEADETDETEQAIRVEAANSVTLTGSSLASLRLTYAHADSMELAPYIEVPAQLVPVPDRMATVGSRVQGRIVAVLVNTGDRVGRHEPIIVIESAEVGRAWADLISARARESVLRRARDRQEKLLQDRVTSVRAFEEAEGEFQIAEAEVRAAVTRMTTYGIVDPGEPPSDPARITLRSPVAGTVTMRSANVGAWVEPSEVLIEVLDLEELWLEAAVYEQEIRFVGMGQKVQVEVRAFPGSVFDGKVERIEGVLDENTRSVGVRIVLPNPQHSDPQHRLLPGMFGTARIRGAQPSGPRSVIAVPWSAVQEINGQNAVFVRVEEGVFEVRTVRIGERTDGFVEVLTGLELGVEVVAEGSFLLKGQLLKSTLAEEEG